MGYGKEIHFFDKPINLGLLPYLVNFAAVDGSGAKGSLDTAALSEFQAALQNKTGDATTTTEERVSSEGTGVTEGKSGNRLDMRNSVDGDEANRGSVRRLNAQWAGEAALDRVASLAPESIPMRVHERAAYEDSYEDDNDDDDEENDEEGVVQEKEEYEASGKSGENNTEEHEPWRKLPTGHLQRRLHEYRTRESNDGSTSSSGVRGTKASAELPIRRRASTTASSDQHMVLAEDDDVSSQAHKVQLKAAAATKRGKQSKKSRSSGGSDSKSLSRLGKKAHLRRMEVAPPPPSVPPFAPPFVNGEATPFYLAERDACRSMAEEMPAPPALIVLLRDPVDRAYSEYQMKVKTTHIDAH